MITTSCNNNAFLTARRPETGTEKEKKKIKTMRRNGMTCKEISKEGDLSVKTLPAMKMPAGKCYNPDRSILNVFMCTGRNIPRILPEGNAGRYPLKISRSDNEIPSLTETQPGLVFGCGRRSSL